MEMGTTPSESVLRWAARAVGADARVVAVKALHEGRTGPWGLRIQHGGGTSDVVLRVPVVGWIGEALIATGAAALRVAEEHGLAAPRLLASDRDGRATGGVAATLETALPGSSASPSRASAERLRAAGAAIAKVHGVPFAPQRDLPRRTRPTQVDDHAMERRWATLYRASAEGERPAVVAALGELTGWPADRAREVVTQTHSTPLLQLADDRLRAIARPEGEMVFVHGDIWAGNMLWHGDTFVALIDWKTPGAGHPGVDLGNLRMKMAVQYGPDAPAHLLAGWQHERGREATAVPYWDAVAALQTPADLDDWEPGFDDHGDELSGPARTARRDAFLRAALDRLDRG
jgi:aminoglycoside phosphotransferase (APT) family kinase protein